MSHLLAGMSVSRSCAAMMWRQNSPASRESGISAPIPTTAMGGSDAAVRLAMHPPRGKCEGLGGNRHAVGPRLMRPGDDGRPLHQVQGDLGHRALARLGEEAAGGPAVERAGGRPGPELIVGAPAGLAVYRPAA